LKFEISISILVLVLLSFIYASCGSVDTNISTDHNTGVEFRVRDSLLLLAINQGDCEAYEHLRSHIYGDLMQYRYFYYSLLMANRHQCAIACFDVYDILQSAFLVNGVDMEARDSASDAMATTYLLRAAELGYEPAVDMLREKTDSIP
jgi:hypothetical protein